MLWLSLTLQQKGQFEFELKEKPTRKWRNAELRRISSKVDVAQTFWSKKLLCRAEAAAQSRLKSYFLKCSELFFRIYNVYIQYTYKSVFFYLSIWSVKGMTVWVTKIQFAVVLSSKVFCVRRKFSVVVVYKKS
jgi:hypothetical protein